MYRNGLQNLLVMRSWGLRRTVVVGEKVGLVLGAAEGAWYKQLS